MTSYRLHYFPETGNSYKLALMLTLCGQAFEPVWTDFGGGATRTAEWRATVNEMGEIPVLEDSGSRLTQTAPILLRLAERYGRFRGDSDNELANPHPTVKGREVDRAAAVLLSGSAGFSTNFTRWSLDPLPFFPRRAIKLMGEFRRFLPKKTTAHRNTGWTRDLLPS